MIQKLTNKLNDRKNNKGFTLVELIVVIVILAILAAILIPGLLKWIDEARDKQYQLEARSVYLAAQAEMAKSYTGTGLGTDEVTIASGDALDTIIDLSALTVAKVVYTPDGKGGITSFTAYFTSSNGVNIKADWTSTGQQWVIATGVAP